MPHSDDVRKDELLDRIAEAIGERLAGDEAAAAERFARQFYASVSLRDLLAEAFEDLVGSALSLWRFSERREPGETKVRVINPDRSEHGYDSAHTVAEVVNDDMPFLVDSVAGELSRRGRTIHLMIHPIVAFERDASGQRIDRSEPREGGREESLIHVEFDQETSPENLNEIRRSLEAVLADVRIVVEDFQPMHERLDEVVRALETDETFPGVSEEARRETQNLLRWVADNHFTFLGYREFEVGPKGEVEVKAGSGLGMLRESTSEDFPLSPETAPSVDRNPVLVISKAGRRSTVHRTVHMDYVGVRRLDRDGRLLGGWSLVGLFTSRVYHDSAATIPYVKRKIDNVLEAAGFPSMSHDAKTLRHLLETFPRDELFQMSEEQLLTTSLGVLQLQERQRLALFVREDPSQRYVSCLVYVPRDRYNTDLRIEMQGILEEAFSGRLSAFYTQVADSALARAHFIIRTTPGEIPDYDTDQIEARLAEAARSWKDRLKREFVADRGEEAGLSLLARYADAFPAAYQERFGLDARTVLLDVDQVEASLASGGLHMSLYRPSDTPEDQVRFKIFHPGKLRLLSNVLPMLENMGLKVIFEVPYKVEPKGELREVWIREVVLSTDSGAAVDLPAVRQKFKDTFGRVWRGEVENDRFNRLVLAAGLDWRQVVVLRAYARYLRQIGVAFSHTYMANTLARNPKVTRLLTELFAVRFDPELDLEDAEDALGARRALTHPIDVRIRQALNKVSKLDEDRILRRFRNLIEATIRTNHFQRDESGQPKPYLSLKFDSRALRELPQPHPHYEVFVYSPRTEAVHLRGGKVARGGIRWSDRLEDFRTEILGLMKAQMVKNAVIVPFGAKGGFIVKRGPGGDPDEFRKEGVECYKTMIRGLLDITDNLYGGIVVAPPDVVRWDDDDSYLVVAADKGTATFSDIANEVAEEYGFWLGDAFASGGSAGYDHKKMGITARGAWESVKRHFREMGRNIDAETFSVVGIGDMSGDVFGNGMLLSQQTRLIGAFNHRHIFIDPDPDPRASHEERQRLFRLERSSWEDYDESVLSPGGGVFDRSAKSVEPSREIRELLGIEETNVNPNELIRALLRTEVDLLWFGGIGTFVKASDESHADTGDRHNDEVRIDARELRCRIVGEGANLGVTQRGRIEYALAGGRINTDFIDNSGGVDCSDHEVNIKILLREVISQGHMSMEERNDLLVKMTDEVADLVLRDNYLQAQAISIAEAGGPFFADQQRELIRYLEREGGLDRALEFLPDDEILAERREHGIGLTRPEISVLLAHSKLNLYEKLLASDLPDEERLTLDLVRYFPTPIQERFGEEITRHRLRREIIATYVTSSMVNRVGPSFVTRLGAETGRGAPDIARAYTAVRESFRLREIWEAIEAIDNESPTPLQIELFHEVGRLVEWATLWFLREKPQQLDISAAVEELQPAVDRLRTGLDELLSEEDVLILSRRTQRYRDWGAPDLLARNVASMEFLGSACDIALIAHGHEDSVEQVARTYFQVGARFSLEWLRNMASDVVGDDPWSKQAVAGLTEELFAHQRALTERVLDRSINGAGDRDALERWIAEHKGPVERLDDLIEELRAAASPELAMIIVAGHQLRLLGGC